MAVKMMKEGTMSEDDFIEEAKVIIKLGRLYSVVAYRNKRSGDSAGNVGEIMEKMSYKIVRHRILLGRIFRPFLYLASGLMADIICRISGSLHLNKSP